MEDWSILDRDYRCYNHYPHYQEKEMNVPAPCPQQPFKGPSPTLTLLFPPCQPPKGGNSREIKNKAEKQRRDKMIQSLLRLASVVPPIAKLGRKLDKISVLRLAAHYLRSHQHVFGSSIDRGPEFSLKFTETLLNNLKGFLITTTYKGIVVVISPNVQEYLGYTELELVGQNVFNIIHKEDHQLLRHRLYPRSCTLTKRGELSIPKETGAVEKIAAALASERRSFVIRFRKLNQQKSEPPQYISCHVEGSLRKADRAGSRGERAVRTGRRARSKENINTCGNDIVFVGMVRPIADTFVNDGILESFRMEYRTRHSIDGEIIQCEQRIALVTGYMTHEVRGVNAMNFMHRDDVRWVIIALREMYEKHRLVGESCYRLMTKNGQFIYMRTLGWLDVDQNSKAVTSFVCTNTVVAEQEGKQLIKLMKKKYTLMTNNYEEPKEEEELSEPENEKQTPPVEDPKQLEKVILHLVTDLPSPRIDDGLNQEPLGNGGTSSHLAIIPPRKEKIHEAIEKSYSVIRSCYSTMAGRKRKRKNPRNCAPREPPPKQQNLYTFTDALQINMLSRSTFYGQTNTSNRMIYTTAGGMPARSICISHPHFSSCFYNDNSVLPEPSPLTNNYSYLNNANNDFFDVSLDLLDPFSSLSLDDINVMPLDSIPYPDSLCTPAPLTPSSPQNSHYQHYLSSLLIQPVTSRPPVLYQPPVPHPPLPPQPPASATPEPSTRKGKGKGKKTCYDNAAVKRSKGQDNTKKQVKKIEENGEPQLPREIEEMITQEFSYSTCLENNGVLPSVDILTDGQIERILDRAEQVDGVSSKNFNEVFQFMQDNGRYFEMTSEERKDGEKSAIKDLYEFTEDESDTE